MRAGRLWCKWQGIGLQLAEVKSLIGRLQQIVATAQADEVIARNCLCGQCGDRFKEKGQMRWPPAGANALLYIRVADLNGELADIFKKPLYEKRSKFTQKNRWEDFLMAA